MLWQYALADFSEQFNVLKVDDDRITPMEKFVGTTTYISLKNNHSWGCIVHVLDARSQGNISGIPKWEPHSRAGIYLRGSPFHAVSVALVINPETGNVSHIFHVVFEDEFYTVPFMREGQIPSN